MASFRDKIKAALIHSLHNDPSDGLSFIRSLRDFQDKLGMTPYWRRELAIREIYKGPMPFVWRPWDDNPVTSPEYEDNYDWCTEIEELCFFIQTIEDYID